MKFNSYFLTNFLQCKLSETKTVNSQHYPENNAIEKILNSNSIITNLVNGISCFFGVKYNN